MKELRKWNKEEFFENAAKKIFVIETNNVIEHENYVEVETRYIYAEPDDDEWWTKEYYDKEVTEKYNKDEYPYGEGRYIKKIYSYENYEDYMSDQWYWED